MIVPGVWGQLDPSGTVFSCFLSWNHKSHCNLSDPVAPYFPNVIQFCSTFHLGVNGGMVHGSQF